MADRSSRGGSPLLVRLGRAVGLTGLAGLTMASGPCGECDPEVHACFELGDLANQRAAVLARAGQPGTGGTSSGPSGSAGESAGGVAGVGGAGAAGEHSPGSGGAAGTTAASSAGGSFAFTPSGPSNWQIVSGWEPANGCPTPEQLNAISVLKGGDIAQWNVLESGSNGRCCYERYAWCGGGRPFLVQGTARVAVLSAGRSPLGAPERASFEHALAEYWLADGSLEHASVASFARLSLRLLALGAPLELVRASQQASLDELGHAAFCFDEAARLTGRVVSVGALPLHGALESETFVEFVRSNLLEGCIGETLAAVQLGEQSRRAADPALSAGLAQIGEDEATHAELAFRILKWCCEHDAQAARAALGRVVAEAPKSRKSPLDQPDLRWANAGRLTPAEAERLDQLTWQGTLLPIFHELLAALATNADRLPAFATPKAVTASA